jgi:hypothetical protein
LTHAGCRGLTDGRDCAENAAAAGKILGWSTAMLGFGEQMMSKKGCFGGAFVLVWLVGWSACTLTGDGIWVVSMIWQAGSAHYASTEGTIVDSRVEVNSDSEGTSYEAKVSYDYQVAGRVYRGERISYSMRFTGGHKAAGDTVRRYAAGKRVRVYYSPPQPAAAVLEPGIRGCDFFMPLFMMPFNLVTIAGWYAVLVSRRKGARPIGMQVRDDGLSVVARLYNVRPITAAAVALFITSFVLILVCGFEIIPVPIDWLVVGAWLVAIGAAAAGYFVFRQPKTRLQYDQLSGRIVILQSDGLSHAFTSSDVIRVGVEDRRWMAAGMPRRHDDDGQRLPSFSPTIAYRDSQGVERTIELANWSSQEAAEWAAHWLRQTLRLKS